MIARFMLWAIRFYRRVLRRGRRHSVCRFVPTCSEYAEQAIRRFGPARGAALAARRLLRCTPLSKGGYDPVPFDPRQPSSPRG